MYICNIVANKIYVPTESSHTTWCLLCGDCSVILCSTRNVRMVPTSEMLRAPSSHSPGKGKIHSYNLKRRGNMYSSGGEHSYLPEPEVFELGIKYFDLGVGGNTHTHTHTINRGSFLSHQAWGTFSSDTGLESNVRRSNNCNKSSYY